MDRETLHTIKEQIESLKGYLNYNNLLATLQKAEAQTLAPGFWDNTPQAQQLLTSIKNKKKHLHDINDLEAL